MGKSKPPPLYDLNAESALIGAALLAPGDVLKMPNVRLLVGDDFADRRHQAIWQAVTELASDGKAIDIVTVGSYLADDGVDAVFLNNLQDACASYLSADRYAETVREYSRKRHTSSALSELGKALYSPNGGFDGGLDDAIETLRDIRRKSGGVVRIYSPTDILSDTTKHPPSVVENLVPGLSAGAFVSPGGEGKTYVTMVLGVCVARGTPFLGLNVQKMPVLIIDLENRLVRVRERFKKVLHGLNLLDNPPPVYFAFDIKARLDSDAIIDEIADQMRRVGARFVILDSLVDFLGNVDENSNPEMARVAERLRAIAENANGTILAIHHTPKNNAATPRGATALRNGIDFNIILSRDGNTVTIKQDKNRDGAECSITARLDWQPDMFSMSLIGTETGRTQKPPDKDEAALLKAIDNAEGWVLSSEVVSAAMKTTNHARTTIHRKLKALVDDGVLESQDAKNGKAYYVRRDLFNDAMSN